MKSHKSADTHCPCESGKLYQACCGLYHHGAVALTAEALMRSRYSAYVLGLENYLLETWHTDTRPTALNLADEPKIKWLGLQIKHAETKHDHTATVEFVARYKINGKAEKMHEISQFMHINKKWYYLKALA